MQYDFLAPKATVSFQIIYNHSICETDLNSISMNNCTFDDCIIVGSNLSNADFNGNRWLNCDFSGSKLNNSDICSLYVEDASFRDVTFESASISDCTFIRCTFDNCNFNHVNMTNTEFQSCVFIKLKLRQSSSFLNRFVDTSFTNCNIKGNFFYNLMINCRFVDSFVSQNLVGYNYGMSQFLGSKDEVDSLIEFFQDNDMYINIAILQINRENGLYDNAMLAGIVAIGRLLQTDLLIRSEQIVFLKLLFDYMCDNNLVAPITIIRSWVALCSIPKEIAENTALTKAKENINMLTNSLHQKHQTFLLRIQGLLGEKPSHAEDAQAILIYAEYIEKPEFPLTGLLGDLQELCAVHAPKPLLLRSESGSFHEWIQSYDSVASCLQILVSLLGIGISVWQLKKKEEPSGKEVETPTPPEPQEANTSLQSHTDIGQVLDLLRQSNVSPETEKLVNEGITVIINNGVAKTSNFGGYNRKNVVKIKVSPHVN